MSIINSEKDKSEQGNRVGINMAKVLNGKLETVETSIMLDTTYFEDPEAMIKLDVSLNELVKDCKVKSLMAFKILTTVSSLFEEIRTYKIKPENQIFLNMVNEEFLFSLEMQIEHTRALIKLFQLKVLPDNMELKENIDRFDELKNMIKPKG
jgi:hypothetical protein